jgi:tripartite-type tricarboxylate transporter receptor subunit TctC
MKRRFESMLALVAASLLSCASAKAQPVADFFKNRNVSLIVGSAPGGGFDTLGRAVARNMGRHIPGQPTIVVRNIPGAGGIVAVNTLYNNVPRDGSTFGLIRNFAALDPLLGTKEISYDATKLLWMGTTSIEVATLFVWHDSPFKSYRDLLTRELKAGADGVRSPSAFYTRILNDLLGAKIRLVPGYKGQNDAYLAIERGEIDAFGVTYYSSLTSTRQDWLKEKKIRILLQYGPMREPALPDAPSVADLLKSDDDRLLFAAAIAPLAFGRPFVLPPEVPEDRLQAMRNAFMQLMEDPVFKAEADKLGLEIDNPRSGESLQRDVERLYATPPHLIKRLVAITSQGQ